MYADLKNTDGYCGGVAPADPDPERDDSMIFVIGFPKVYAPTFYRRVRFLLCRSGRLPAHPLRLLPRHGRTRRRARGPRRGLNRGAPYEVVPENIRIPDELAGIPAAEIFE